ncbi:MmgE/PrpD family protein [Paraburkholderia tropica]|uniref:MmgE/PrpD family protein n=1 Tax=Paraburkholderia tropica TaxID=92647 RepID=UPI0008002CA0|nr:MmgE/PrpD family protein [Paraburkholderia tropica]OBR46263.1 hypothetical protein A6456_29490 [Paraburkholderia tropica]
MNSVSARIAALATRGGYQELEPQIVAHAKRAIADTLLVSFAAASVATNRSLAGVWRQMGGAPQAATWEHDSLRVPTIHAAWINALYASALDYDSLNGSVHADAVCLPVAWALAVERKRSGAELVAALVWGAEVMTRLAFAREGAQKGWSATGIYGGVGAAVAASRMLGLDEVRARHAIGLAAAQAAGTQQANAERTLSKRLQPAFAARNGACAALLAEAGATAPALAFEGPFGLRNLYESADDSGWLHAPRPEFAYARTAFKRYPVCACSHAALEACKTVVHESRLTPNDIERVTVRLTPFMQRLVGAPFSLRADPEVMAQFSVQYAIAVLLLRGDVGLDALEPTSVDDAAVFRMISRVKVEVDGRASGELAPASVSVRTRDGREILACCEHFPGGPSAPMDDAQHRRKLLDCALKAGLPVNAQDIGHLIDAIDSIEAFASMDVFERTCREILRLTHVE